MEIQDKSTRNSWKELLQLIQKEGDSYTDHDKRTCIELLNVSLHLSDFSDITSPLDVLSQSSKWVYPKAKEVENFVLDSYLSPSFAYSYGERLFNYSKDASVNQLDSFIIPLLKKSPRSRRAVAVIWDPKKDSYFDKYVPGLIYINFILRNNTLHATCSIRSCDCYVGLPANMYELYVLSTYVSKKLGCEVGMITLHLLSAHIFKDYAEDIRRITG